MARRAAAGGARFVGFVFFPKSPRAIAPAEAAEIASTLPRAVNRVGVVVDAGDDFLRAIVDTLLLDFLQCHGSESSTRIQEIKDTFGVPVIKAVGIRRPSDLAAAAAFEDVADAILLDSGPAEPDALPGGNGVPFPWSVAGQRSWRKPWFLAGGLSAANLAQAVRESGTQAVDVSSGVEDAPGVKSAVKIEEFLKVAATL